MKKLVSVVLLFVLVSCTKNSTSDSFNPDPVDDGPDMVETLTDEEIMDLTQRETFRYFWDFAHAGSGAARERYHPTNPSLDENVVTTGGTGFGLMVLIVGIERGYISRTQGVARFQTILNFLENADRFHGAWPHWLDGNNGNVIPFSPLDNGGDLVETSFLAQGLICVKEYFKNGSTEEIALATKADELWKGVEWSWYTQGQNALFWHWSSSNGFAINLKLTGYNETLVTYVLAAASPDYPITLDAYAEGWADNGNIVSSNTQYGIPLLVKHGGSEQFGGPLFFAHYSYLGLKPRGLSDQYANYWDVNVNHTNINYQYCVTNPLNIPDYGPDCWGLSASYSRNADGSLGYSAHRPGNDVGVISPTAAISSIPYTPEKSLAAMHFFYSKKDILLGTAGFYDAFSPKYGYWVANAYLAIDQGPQIIMIENYRTGLLWNLFMQNEDVQNGLNLLEFSY